jgi:hypothetical protein
MLGHEGPLSVAATCSKHLGRVRSWSGLKVRDDSAHLHPLRFRTYARHPALHRLDLESEVLSVEALNVTGRLRLSQPSGEPEDLECEGAFSNHGGVGEWLDKK